MKRLAHLTILHTLALSILNATQIVAIKILQRQHQLYQPITILTFSNWCNLRVIKFKSALGVPLAVSASKIATVCLGAAQKIMDRFVASKQCVRRMIKKVTNLVVNGL